MDKKLASEEFQMVIDDVIPGKVPYKPEVLLNILKCTKRSAVKSFMNSSACVGRKELYHKTLGIPASISCT